jgi:hypothetical protein
LRVPPAAESAHAALSLRQLPPRRGWITPAELYKLTGYQSAKRQKMMLGKMDVSFRSRDADGLLLVSRALFQDAIQSGGTATARAQRRRAERRLDLAYSVP